MIFCNCLGFIEVSKTMKHLLVVDDEKALADMMGRMLEGEGFLVNVQYDSVNALEVFQSNPKIFDLVITDHVMPNMLGLELVAELKKIRPEIPIILCTGYCPSLSGKDVIEMGVCEVLLKPVSREHLCQTVQKLIN